MENHPEDPRTDEEHEHQEGGPVKTFLEHLEDLRWVLIKSLVGLGVGMLICLIAGDQVVRILERPLRHAKARYPGANQVWTILSGTNIFKTLTLTDEQQARWATSSNRFQVWQLDLVPNGTNGFIVALKQDAKTDPEIAQQ